MNQWVDRIGSIMAGMGVLESAQITVLGPPTWFDVAFCFGSVFACGVILAWRGAI